MNINRSSERTLAGVNRARWRHVRSRRTRTRIMLQIAAGPKNKCATDGANGRARPPSISVIYVPLQRPRVYPRRVPPRWPLFVVIYRMFCTNISVFSFFSLKLPRCLDDVYVYLHICVRACYFLMRKKKCIKLTAKIIKLNLH